MKIIYTCLRNVRLTNHCLKTNFIVELSSFKVGLSWDNQAKVGEPHIMGVVRNIHSFNRELD